MEYKMLTGGMVRRIDDDGSMRDIPPDTRNRDWREFVAWQADGGVPHPVDPPPPATVSRFQLRVALHEAGLLTAADAKMAAGATPARARIAWETAGTFRRDAAVVAALGLTATQLDTIFATAQGVTE